MESPGLVLAPRVTLYHGSQDPESVGPANEAWSGGSYRASELQHRIGTSHPAVDRVHRLG